MKNWIFFTVLIWTLTACQNEDNNSSLDPLPSWNDNANKKRILNFVYEAIDEGHIHFIEEEERIAVFDNDGTLWSEQPLYFQLIFALDRIKYLRSEHPEWDTLMPFKAALNDDFGAIMTGGHEALFEILFASHTGMTEETFENMVLAWSDTALHPIKSIKYSKLVYQPMLELLTFLQENHFKTYIVSGGTVGFMRPLLSATYHIPPEQIIGTTFKNKYSYENGSGSIVREPVLFFNNDKQGKPENISRIIGRKPVMAFGNSDGDLAMLQWTASQEHYFNAFVHHTDSISEWAYDRESPIGKLNEGLNQAQEDHWMVIDMEKDWNVIYPFELNQHP